MQCPHCTTDLTERHPEITLYGRPVTAIYVECPSCAHIDLMVSSNALRTEFEAHENALQKRPHNAITNPHEKKSSKLLSQGERLGIIHAIRTLSLLYKRTTAAIRQPSSTAAFALPRLILSMFAAFVVGSIAFAGYQQHRAAECAWCHRTTNLEVHHIIPQHIRPDLADDPRNLITLCRPCHYILAHRRNWQDYNPYVAIMVTLANSTNWPPPIKDDSPPDIWSLSVPPPSVGRVSDVASPKPTHPQRSTP